VCPLLCVEMLICQSQPLLLAFLGFYGVEGVSVFLLEVLAVGGCSLAVLGTLGSCMVS